MYTTHKGRQRIIGDYSVETVAIYWKPKETFEWEVGQLHCDTQIVVTIVMVTTNFSIWSDLE